MITTRTRFTRAVIALLAALTLAVAGGSVAHANIPGGWPPGWSGEQPNDEELWAMLGGRPDGEYDGEVDIWDYPGQIGPSPCAGHPVCGDDGSGDSEVGDWTVIIIKPKPEPEGGTEYTLGIQIRIRFEKKGRITMKHTRIVWHRTDPYVATYNDPPAGTQPNNDVPPEGTGSCLEYGYTPESNYTEQGCTYWQRIA